MYRTKDTSNANVLFTGPMIQLMPRDSLVLGSQATGEHQPPPDIHRPQLACFYVLGGVHRVPVQAAAPKEQRFTRPPSTVGRESYPGLADSESNSICSVSKVPTRDRVPRALAGGKIALQLSFLHLRHISAKSRPAVPLAASEFCVLLLEVHGFSIPGGPCHGHFDAWCRVQLHTAPSSMVYGPWTHYCPAPCALASEQ